MSDNTPFAAHRLRSRCLRGVLAAFGLLTGLLLTGCETTPTAPPTLEEQVAASKSTIRSLEAKVKAAESVRGTSGDYVAALKGQGSEQAHHLLLPPAELGRAASALLPYSFDANSLHKDVTGTMEVLSASDFAMARSNRFNFKVLMKGKNLKYSGDAGSYASHINKVKEGLAVGLEVTLRAHVWVENGQLKVKLLATGCHLRKNSSSQYEKIIKSSMNNRLFKPTFKIKAGPDRVNGAAVRPFRALVTENQIVISLKP